MKDFEQIEICQGVELVVALADRFKTNVMSVSFSCPLKSETASKNALAINLISHSGKEYPTMTALNKKLAQLYGASIYGSVNKLGENQVLSLNMTSLDDRFSLIGGKISNECIKLLLSLIFNPNVDENGDFSNEELSREKRLLVEKIESEENEKRTYCLRQAEKSMFKNEPYSINRLGTIDDINALTSNDVTDALSAMLKQSKIQFTVVGNVDVENITEILKGAFANQQRDYVPPVKSVFVPKADSVNTITERIDVKQGKLVLGFRVDMPEDADNTADMRAFSDVFGGGPYSKLFANVREKLSLCYYCSARYDRRKSCIMIQCGCEEENMDKAVDEILNQLEEIKNGNISEEFASSKIGLTDIINSVNDESISLMAWYSTQITDNDIKSPKQSADNNNAVKIDDVIACAKLLSLDTVYKLVGNKEGE